MNLRDFAVGVWVVAVTLAVYVALPALALGRARGRHSWAPEALAGIAWAMLTTLVLVPALARLHLLNWLTSLLVPFAWPIGLWVYRHRGAPLVDFRQLCRDLTLRAMSVENIRGEIPRWPFSPAVTAVTMLGVLGIFWRALHELRLPTAGAYDTLGAARLLLEHGEWRGDPAALMTALIARISMADAMQVVRFLHPLAIIGCLLSVALVLERISRRPVIALAPAFAIAAVSTAPVRISMPALAPPFAWFFVLSLPALIAIAADRVHRRDRWHIVAAALVATIAWSRPDSGPERSLPLEYDAASRVALQIRRTFRDHEWLIVAPPEQRFAVERSASHYDVNEFVRRYAGRSGDRAFRFSQPERRLFVSLEKKPLARARVQRDAFEICEAYLRVHAGASVYYDDDDIRVYYFTR